MAWTKAKTAIVVGVGVLVVVGTTTITIKKNQWLKKEIQEHETYSWEVSNLQPEPFVAAGILDKTTPQVRIVDSKYDHHVGAFTRGDATKHDKSGNFISKTTYGSQSIGVGVDASWIILNAYETARLHTIFPADMPTGRYDYIANLPHDSMMRLREEIKNKFGLVGNKIMVTTNVFALLLTNPDSPAFKEPSYIDGFRSLKVSLENLVTRRFPVVDLTGLTNQYECKFDFPMVNTSSEEGKQEILQALHDQLGLDLIATNMPIEMLVVEKVK